MTTMFTGGFGVSNQQGNRPNFQGNNHVPPPGAISLNQLANMPMRGLTPDPPMFQKRMVKKGKFMCNKGDNPNLIPIGGVKPAVPTSQWSQSSHYQDNMLLLPTLNLAKATNQIPPPPGLYNPLSVVHPLNSVQYPAYNPYQQNQSSQAHSFYPSNQTTGQAYSYGYDIDPTQPVTYPHLQQATTSSLPATSPASSATTTNVSQSSYDWSTYYAQVAQFVQQFQQQHQQEEQSKKDDKDAKLTALQVSAMAYVHAQQIANQQFEQREKQQPPPPQSQGTSSVSEASSFQNVPQTVTSTTTSVKGAPVLYSKENLASHNVSKEYQKQLLSKETEEDMKRLIELKEQQGKFEAQFAQWEVTLKTFQAQNVGHPNYAEFEAQWEEFRTRLLERRNHLQSLVNQTTERLANLQKKKSSAVDSLMSQPSIAHILRNTRPPPPSQPPPPPPSDDDDIEILPTPPKKKLIEVGLFANDDIEPEVDFTKNDKKTAPPKSSFETKAKPTDEDDDLQMDVDFGAPDEESDALQKKKEEEQIRMGGLKFFKSCLDQISSIKEKAPNQNQSINRPDSSQKAYQPKKSIDFSQMKTRQSSIYSDDCVLRNRSPSQCREEKPAVLVPPESRQRLRGKEGTNSLKSDLFAEAPKKTEKKDSSYNLSGGSFVEFNKRAFEDELQSLPPLIQPQQRSQSPATMAATVLETEEDEKRKRDKERREADELLKSEHDDLFEGLLDQPDPDSLKRPTKFARGGQFPYERRLPPPEYYPYDNRGKSDVEYRSMEAMESEYFHRTAGRRDCSSGDFEKNSRRPHSSDDFDSRFIEQIRRKNQEARNYEEHIAHVLPCRDRNSENGYNDRREHRQQDRGNRNDRGSRREKHQPPTLNILEIIGNSTYSDWTKRLGKPFVIILRGLPGSGKSFCARKIREVATENDYSTKLLSIDEYFMNEIEKIVEENGRKVLKKTFGYLYTNSRDEERYKELLFEKFKATVQSKEYDVIIIDAFNELTSAWKAFFDYTETYQGSPFVVEMSLIDPCKCFHRNGHDRTLEDILRMKQRFQRLPPQFARYTCDIEDEEKRRKEELEQLQPAMEVEQWKRKQQEEEATTKVDQIRQPAIEQKKKQMAGELRKYQEETELRERDGKMPSSAVEEANKEPENNNNAVKGQPSSESPVEMELETSVREKLDTPISEKVDTPSTPKVPDEDIPDFPADDSETIEDPELRVFVKNVLRIARKFINRTLNKLKTTCRERLWFNRLDDYRMKESEEEYNKTSECGSFLDSLLYQQEATRKIKKRICFADEDKVSRKLGKKCNLVKVIYFDREEPEDSATEYRDLEGDGKWRTQIESSSETDIFATSQPEGKPLQGTDANPSSVSSSSLVTTEDEVTTTTSDIVGSSTIS